MRLIDHYQAEIANLSAKEIKSANVRWHAAVKRALILHGWTSDLPPAAYTYRSVKVDVWDKDPNTEKYVVTTYPVMRFFLNRSLTELAEVYRATRRPRSATDSPDDQRHRETIESSPEFLETRPQER